MGRLCCPSGAPRRWGPRGRGSALPLAEAGPPGLRTTVELPCAARGVADEGSPARCHPHARRPELRPDGDLHGRAPRRRGARAGPQPAERRVSSTTPWTAGSSAQSDAAQVFSGGPVEPDALIALAHIGDEIRSGSTDDADSAYLAPLSGDIASADLAADPALVAGRISGLRVFRGYSGWAPGQLEAEIESGSWLVLDTDAGRRVHRRTRRTVAGRAAPPARSPRLAGLGARRPLLELRSSAPPQRATSPTGQREDDVSGRPETSSPRVVCGCDMNAARSARSGPQRGAELRRGGLDRGDDRRGVGVGERAVRSLQPQAEGQAARPVRTRWRPGRRRTARGRRAGRRRPGGSPCRAARPARRRRATNARSRSLDGWRLVGFHRTALGSAAEHDRQVELEHCHPLVDPECFEHLGGDLADGADRGRARRAASPSVWDAVRAAPDPGRPARRFRSPRRSRATPPSPPALPRRRARRRAPRARRGARPDPAGRRGRSRTVRRQAGGATR